MMIRTLIACMIFAGYMMVGTAIAAPEIALRTGVHERYNRLVFDWPHPVNFTFKQEGDGVNIQFTKDAVIRIGSSRIEALPLLRHFQQVNNASGLQITFQIPVKARIESFRLGNKVAFDILAMDKAKPKFYDAPPVPPQATEKSPPAAQAPELKKNVQTLADHIFAKPSEKILHKPTEKYSGSDTIIKVDPKQLTKMAAFVRAGKLWLVVDQALPDFTPRIEGAGFEEISKNARRIDLKDATAFIFDVSGNQANYSVTRNQTEWQVAILGASNSSPVRPDELPISFRPENQKIGKNAISIYAGQNPRVITLRDKTVGDQLWIIPVRSPEGHVSHTRSTPDYKFLSTLMGAAIAPASKNLEVTTQKEYVILTAKTGNILASAPVDRATGIIEPAYVNVFDLDEANDRGFTRQRQILEGAIIKQEEDSEKANLTLDMARLYITEGFGQEASGLLRVAQTLKLSLEDTPEYQALQGMSAALTGDLEKAQDFLKRPRLKSQPAAKLWLGYALAAGQKWPEARMVFNDTENEENSLPEKLRPRFYIAKAQAALDVNDSMAVIKLLNQINPKAVLTPSEKSARDYIYARLDFLSDEKKSALESYEELAKGKDQFYRIKAELDMTAMKLAAKEIKLPDAIDRLERLRFSWRGDRLEIEVMRRLGQYYADNKQYMEALTLWRQAAGLSQNSDDTDAITQSMRDVFEKLYVANEVKNLSPLQAVAIFERFSELTPAGKSGSIASSNLADRLASVDLLDEADRLLTKQLKQQQPGEEAAQFGARIAQWRLLNGNATGALKILDDTVQEGSVSDALSQRRLLLRARALADDNKTEEALTLLSASQTTEALSLKADINWRQNRWSDSAMALQSLVTRYRDEDKAGIDGPTPPLILKMAIAMMLDDNKPGLALLNAQYGEFMATTPNAQAFNLITKASRGSSLADLETLKNQVGEVELFQKFLKDFDS